MKILVSGASGGIGGAVCELLEARGDTVVRINRADFALPGAEILHGERDFDAFVFATGMCPVVSLRKTDEALFAQTLEVNCGYFLRIMREIVGGKCYSPRGMKVVAVSSVSALKGWPGGAAYCASKGALSAMCRALDAELAPRGISVAALEPSHVATRMFSQCAARMGVGQDAAMAPHDFAMSIVEKLKS